jgi:hypothetical protein
MKRISFSEYDASHLYDLALQNFQEDCVLCNQLKERLTTIIGKDEVRRIKTQQNKHPYLKKVISKK